MPHRDIVLGRTSRRGGLLLGLGVGIAIAVPISLAGAGSAVPAPALVGATSIVQAEGTATRPNASILRAGDVVRVELNELLGPSRITEVVRIIRVDGTIRLPYVGSVKVAGLDNFDATRVIRKAIRDASLTQTGESYLELLDRPEVAATADARIQPGDSLVIEVWELLGPGDQSTMRRRVSEDGRAMPMFLDAIPLHGLTTDEAEAQIAKGYKDRSMIDRPIVLVTIEPKLDRVIGPPPGRP